MAEGGHHSVGDQHRICAQCVGVDRGTDHGRTVAVGGHSFSVRSAMWLVVAGAKRQFQNESHAPDVAIHFVA